MRLSESKLIQLYNLKLNQRLITMNDISHYSSDELSLQVFNTEELYNLIGNRVALFRTLEDTYLYSYEQYQTLLDDLDQEDIQ